MQPETSTNDDIHTILGRFNTWAAKQSTNDDGPGLLQAGAGEVRELAYEEAIRRYGSWPPTPANTAKTAAPATQSVAQPVPSAAILAMEQSTVADPALAGTPALADSSEAASVVHPQAKVRKTTSLPALKPPAKAAANAAEKETRPTRREKPESQKKCTSSTDDLNPIAAKFVKPAGAVAERKARAARPATHGKKNTAQPAEAEKGHIVPPARPNAAKPNASRRTPFREVLAQTVELASVPAPTTPVSAAAERKSRISIRFSSQEELRVREYAARVGLTVSAYLRQRALRTEQTDAALYRHATAQETGPTSLTDTRHVRGLRALFAGWFSSWSAEARQHRT